MLVVQNGAFLHVDMETLLSRTCEFHIVADLSLQADIRDETVIGLRIKTGKIASVGIAVRIAVGDIEDEDEIIAVGERGHQVFPPDSAVSAFLRDLKNSLCWW